MTLTLHWFLPTNGDSRSDLSLGNAVGAAGSRVRDGSGERAPDIGYIGQIARSAEQLGFDAALTPTSSWCEDAWVMTAALTPGDRALQVPRRVPPRPTSPTLAAQMAATFQRISGGRLLLNVVTGGDDAEQRRFGDHLDKEQRYERCGEFLEIFRALWEGEPVDFNGRHYDRRGRPDRPRRRLARALLRRLLGARARRRRRPRRRLPDLGRAAGRGRREARPGRALRADAAAASCASGSGCT